MREILADWIKTTYPDWMICQAGSAEEVMVDEDDFIFDLAIIDIGLPGLNGLEMTHKIKQKKPETRVVLISLSEEKPIENKALMAGADAFLPKRMLYVNLMPVLLNLIAKED